MLIARQTVNAVRRPGSKDFTRGFLVVAPGLTIKDRLRVLVPPCFIVLCENAAISKLVYDFISAFPRKNEDATTTLENGRLPLFRNFDEATGNPLPRPNTLRIDNEQLEAGDALDDNFRSMAADEIERFRREIVERSGDARTAESITDQELLREVMNTVGKEGQLGGSIRCVVSVSMLTEGWDANTVTHVLGVRAFGTQLLCGQVIGRALRRHSYDLNEEGLFNAEYAGVLSPDLVGPSITRNSGIIGEGVDLSLAHLGDMRPSTLLFHLTRRLPDSKFRLFGQLKRVARPWLDEGHLVCKGDTYPALLMYQELADMACNRIVTGITQRFLGERRSRPCWTPTTRPGPRGSSTSTGPSPSSGTWTRSGRTSGRSWRAPFTR